MDVNQIDIKENDIKAYCTIFLQIQLARTSFRFITTN